MVERFGEDNQGAPFSAEAVDLLAEGERLLDAGRLDEAEEKLRAAVEHAPESAYIRNKLGVCYARQRRLEEARQQFMHAVAIEPHNAAAHSNIGNLHREAGRLDEAVTAYLEALRHDPDYHVAHHNLGAAYKAQGRIADAVTHLKRANRLEKDDFRRQARERAGRHNWTGTLFWVAIGALALFLLMR